MKLQSKQREGKKVRGVYDPARTPLQRVLLSGVLPVQRQQELIRVAHALEPMRLFQQLEQLRQAVFRCATSCSPCVPGSPSAPLRVFPVEDDTGGNVPAERSVPDPAEVLDTLHPEQERRKRILGWRRTKTRPF